MNSSNPTSLHPFDKRPFSYRHAFEIVYVEDGVDSQRVSEILSLVQPREVIPIHHYKDVFCRPHQDVVLQKQSPALILANKRAPFFYPGAPVCQSFGNEHFYYTSVAMNCLFDCEYCYLQGMYPSGNVVVFLNYQDYLDELNHLLTQHSVYLCLSYDTDLFPLEAISHAISFWLDVASTKSNFRMEIRTKAAPKHLRPLPNVYYAFTISPQPVIDAYEHRAASLQNRLQAVKEALAAGCKVRLCFDPMIVVPNWEDIYKEMLQEVLSTVPIEQLSDVSIGSFRISKDYLKILRRVRPDGAIGFYPFRLKDGYYHYPDDTAARMQSLVYDAIASRLPAERIFFDQESL
ncbi:MAG: radical SAM protein [Lachnospiraceae bacterium]|nr:radical SAM protein [Lachnospiraceae bacterium]